MFTSWQVICKYHILLHALLLEKEGGGGGRDSICIRPVPDCKGPSQLGLGTVIWDSSHYPEPFVFFLPYLPAACKSREALDCLDWGWGTPEAGSYSDDVGRPSSIPSEDFTVWLLSGTPHPQSVRTPNKLTVCSGWTSAEPYLGLSLWLRRRSWALFGSPQGRHSYNGVFWDGVPLCSPGWAWTHDHPDLVLLSLGLQGYKPSQLLHYCV